MVKGPINKIAIISDRLQYLDESRLEAIRKVIDSTDAVSFLIRDTDRPLSLNDPFTYSDRVHFIRAAFREAFSLGKVTYAPVVGSRYNATARIVAVQQGVTNVQMTWLPRAVPSDVAILGFAEDEAASLLAIYPGWTQVSGFSVSPEEEQAAIEGFLNADPDKSGLPARVLARLNEFKAKADWSRLEEEIRNRDSIRKQFGEGPHLTADAVCTFRGQVLLIKRANPPFKGMYALPGGIIDSGEDFAAAAIREMQEETRISSSGEPLSTEAAQLLMSNAEPRIYDAPRRDPRGSYRAHAFHFDFDRLGVAPAVSGADDAECAEWVPLGKLTPKMLAFDHFDILHDMLGLP